MTTIAAFDFDGTLTRRDTVVPFLREIAGTAPLLAGLAARAHRLVPAATRRDRDLLRAIATEQVFTGRSVDEVTAAAAAFGRRVTASCLRADTVARLRWHLEVGHRVVIVSASYEQYVRVVAAELGAEAVLATRLEAIDGTYTGRLDGGNCRGATKLTRLDQWLAEHELGRARASIWAYGDSAGDRELLAAADHPHWVRKPLASVAPAPTR